MEYQESNFGQLCARQMLYPVYNCFGSTHMSILNAYVAHFELPSRKIVPYPFQKLESSSIKNEFIFKVKTLNIFYLYSEFKF